MSNTSKQLFGCVILLGLALLVDSELEPTFECINNKIQEEIEPIMVPQEQANANHSKRGVREAIRISVQSFLDGDSRTCYNVGDIVYIGSTSSQECSNIITTNCFVACTSIHILDSTRRTYLLDVILPQALLFLESTLLVDRVQGNLILQSGMCGSVPIQSNVQNADLVLYLTSRPTMGSVLAYAAECQRDGSGRPIAGYINFNPILFKLQSQSLQTNIGVTLHEITHVLGFSSSRFRDDPSSILLSETKQYAKAPRQIVKIKTPTVVQVAREHYGCSNLNGVEIEDGGGNGTTGSHWEKRIAMNEYMTATSSSNPIVSVLTLAYLQDRGWYSINWEKAQFLSWGYKRGCSFVGGSCSSWTHEDGACDMDNREVDDCTFDRTAKGSCALKNYQSSIPLAFQNYPDPTLGSSELTDYCGFVQMYSNADCRYSENAIESDKNYFNEEFKSNSRCFVAYLSPTNQGILPQNTYLPKCYQLNCTGPNSYRVKVADIWYECNNASQEIQIVKGPTGKLRCTNVTLDCNGTIEDNSWPLLSSISPTKGEEGDLIILLGEKFEDGMQVEVGGALATKVTVLSSFNVTARLGDYSQIKLEDTTYVLVRLPNGKTHQIYNIFQVNKNDLFQDFWRLIKKHWKISAGVVGSLLLIIIFVSVFRCLRRRKKIAPSS